MGRSGFVGAAVAVAGWAVLFGGVAQALPPMSQPPMPVLEAIVLTEAAGEPYAGKVAVAEVIRNRGWNPKGFCGLQRRDLHRFLARQPAWAQAQARRALQEARAGSNRSGQATHFENVKAFGWPAWAREMEVTVTIGHLTFFRKARR